MEIDTARLVLRELRPDDAAAANAYERDVDVVRYQSHGVRTLEESRAYIASSLAEAQLEPRPHFDLAICARGTDTMIGRVGLGLRSRDDREAALWFVLDPRHQRLGYVTEACAALLDLAFGPLALHRVLIDADARNAASIRVAERLGMTREAHLRENAWVKGEWTDSVILAILDREWTARAAR